MVSCPSRRLFEVVSVSIGSCAAAAVRAVGVLNPAGGGLQIAAGGHSAQGAGVWGLFNSTTWAPDHVEAREDDLSLVSRSTPTHTPR